MTARARTPRLCKILQPLTQNGVLPAAKAKEIVMEFMRGNVGPATELLTSKEIPTVFLPLLEELKKEVYEQC